MKEVTMDYLVTKNRKPVLIESGNPENKNTVESLQEYMKGGVK